MMDNNIISSSRNLLAADQAAPKKPGKTSVNGQDDRFAQDLAGAQAVAAQNPQGVNGFVAQPAASSAPVEGAVSTMEGTNGKQATQVDSSRVGPRANALGSMERPGTGAERSPLTLASAVSMNTAAAIAGPMPWGKQWVFEGVNRNSDIQPLFEANPKATELQSEVRKGGEAAGALEGVTGLMAEMAKAGKLLSQESAKSLDQSALRAALEADTAAAQDQLDSMAQGVAKSMDASMDPSGLSEMAQLAGSGMAERPEMLEAKPVRTNGPIANASFSGSEYLSTLEALKAGQIGGKPGAQTGTETGQGNSEGQSLNAKAGLKVIEGGQRSRKGAAEFDKFEDLSSSAGAAQANLGVSSNAGLMTGAAIDSQSAVVGHVVKGAMSQERLSSESLNGISSGIRTLSPNGGGEMKIRLNPGNLGELHVKVMTQGNQVGLQIQASDERAKKILEESMSSLKTSLAAQHLTLAQVDLSVAQTQNASNGSEGNMQGQQHQQQQQFGDLLGQNRGFDRNGSGSDRWSGGNGSEERTAAGQGIRSASSALSGSARAAAASTATRAYAQAGRLDVRA